MVSVSLKFIKPSKMDIKNYVIQIEEGLKEEGKIRERSLGRTLKGWKGERPVMRSRVDLNKGIVTTGPTGSKKAVFKWVYLSQGTKIRWAVMSPNWKSKTVPNRLGNKSGRGRVIIAGKRAMQKRNIKPRPGIKGRDWPRRLSNVRQRPYKRLMEKRMKLAAKGTFK